MFGGGPVPELTRNQDIKLNSRARLRPRSGALVSRTPEIALVRSPPAKWPHHHTRCGQFVRAWHASMSEQPERETLDLIEMRRQLTALRSKYSDNLLIASLLNRFLVKVAFLVEPTDLAQEQYLRSEFERTLIRSKRSRHVRNLSKPQRRRASIDC